MINNKQHYLDRIAFRMECLEGAREDLNKWKPTWDDYEDEICLLIDTNDRTEVGGMTVSFILRELAYDKYVDLCHDVFNANYDNLTYTDFQERLSEVAEWERSVKEAQEDLDHFIQFGE